MRTAEDSAVEHPWQLQVGGVAGLASELHFQVTANDAGSGYVQSHIVFSIGSLKKIPDQDNRRQQKYAAYDDRLPDNHPDEVLPRQCRNITGEPAAQGVNADQEYDQEPHRP